MTNDLKSNLISIDEVCEILQVSERTARELVKQCKNTQTAKTSTGSVKMLYDINEIRSLQQQQKMKQDLQTAQQEQKALQKIMNTADKLSDKNDIKTLGTAFANKLDEIPDDCDDETFDQMYNASMFLVGKMLARSERRLKISEERRLNTEREKQEIEKDRNELLCFKQEVNNIYIKKYKSKELRSKIISLIRKKAYESNIDYSTFTVNMYGKYDGIHNFPFRENYRGYLDTIQARGHLKEFYEMILNS